MTLVLPSTAFFNSRSRVCSLSLMVAEETLPLSNWAQTRMVGGEFLRFSPGVGRPGP